MLQRSILLSALVVALGSIQGLVGQSASHAADGSAAKAKPAGKAQLADSRRTVLLEAERFQNLGGWVVDSQFMDQMGSPFLLAHGLGTPVRDATTTATFPAPGTYYVWVRTRDWVASWHAAGEPGRFRLLVDGKTLPTTFGVEGAPWHWQPGGSVSIPAKQVKVALHDLTGFEGRCDAILFSLDNFTPPNKEPEMTALRRRLLGLPAKPKDAGKFDLVVVGGGMAGTCAALSAARLGLSVALVQDRPVLAGNNSSEVRVWLNGARNLKPWPRVGDIVAELEPKHRAHPGTAEIYEDQRRIDVVRAEKNIKLLLGWRVNSVETAQGHVKAVSAQDVVTGHRVRLCGTLFADCTGDAALGFLAGAQLEMTSKGHMGPSNLWSVVDTGKSSAFPRCPWACDLSHKPFPSDRSALGQWFWESGFDRDPIVDAERIRDTNFRGMYGAWDAVKNVQKRFLNYRLQWAAYVAGKRESRRLMGDIVLSKDDFVSGKKFPDGCVITGWSMDLHLADKQYNKGFESDPFISKANFGSYKRPFWIPYRCFYSRNVPNLFMAGRDISVTHEGLGPVRVMRTCGLMGEIVGMAASLCKKHDTAPRGVYEKHLDELKELMGRGVGKIHGEPIKGS